MKLIKTLALLKLAQAHQGSCSVNNGGCSHDCVQETADTYSCECPNCWDMSDDDLKCYPSDNKISTYCGSNQMIITMNKCVLEGSHDWESAQMVDGPECVFVEDQDNTDYVQLTNGLDECGMTLSQGENDTLVYTNTLQVKAASIGGMIVTQPNIEWDFSCAYDTEYEINESLTVNAAALSQGFSQTNAQFEFSFDFYTDGTYTNTTDSAEFQVGQYVNFGVSMNGGEALSSLNFVASQCEVTNGDLTYVVFDMNNPDHCEAAPPVFFSQATSSNPAVSFYSYMGFAFMDDDSEQSDQRISCTVKVCHEDDVDSACFTGCYNSTMPAM